MACHISVHLVVYSTGQQHTGSTGSEQQGTQIAAGHEHHMVCGRCWDHCSTAVTVAQYAKHPLPRLLFPCRSRHGRLRMAQQYRGGLWPSGSVPLWSGSLHAGEACCSSQPVEAGHSGELECCWPVIVAVAPPQVALAQDQAPLQCSYTKIRRTAVQTRRCHVACSVCCYRPSSAHFDQQVLTCAASSLLASDMCSSTLHHHAAACNAKCDGCCAYHIQPPAPGLL